MEDEFKASDVLAAVREERAVRRKRITWGRSKLNKFRAELIKLKTVDASYADMQLWLRKEKRLKVYRSTIKRFLDKHTSVMDEGG